MKLQRNQILALSIEFSELAATRTALTRGRGYLGGWYTHGNQILGLGNNGQLFGTEHGPGPNVQTVRVDWFKEKNSWTFTLARIGYHNSNFDQHFITDAGKRKGPAILDRKSTRLNSSHVAIS